MGYSLMGFVIVFLALSAADRAYVDYRANGQPGPLIWCFWFLLVTVVCLAVGLVSLGPDYRVDRFIFCLITAGAIALVVGEILWEAA